MGPKPNKKDASKINCVYTPYNEETQDREIGESTHTFLKGLHWMDVLLHATQAFYSCHSSHPLSDSPVRD